MDKKKNLEKILLIIAIMILLAGIFVTVYTSVPLYEPGIEGEKLSQTNIMQGMVTVNVVEGEKIEGG